MRSTPKRNAEIVRAACGLSRGSEDVSAFLLLMKKLYHATDITFKELTGERAAVKSGFTSLRSANLHTSFCKNRTKRPILGADIRPIISLTTR